MSPKSLRCGKTPASWLAQAQLWWVAPHLGAGGRGSVGAEKPEKFGAALPAGLSERRLPNLEGRQAAQRNETMRVELPDLGKQRVLSGLHPIAVVVSNSGVNSCSTVSLVCVRHLDEVKAQHSAIIGHRRCIEATRPGEAGQQR